MGRTAVTPPAAGPRAWSWLVLSGLVIVLDQATKAWVLAVLVPGEHVPVIRGLFHWTLVFNEGAAFSFLADGALWQRWFLAALAVTLSIVLVVWLARTPRGDWRTALPLALVLGGAVGNLIDRVVAGKVTDFVLVYIGSWPWPAFNVADSAISIGVVLLLLFGLREARRDVR